MPYVTAEFSLLFWHKFLSRVDAEVTRVTAHVRGHLRPRRTTAITAEFMLKDAELSRAEVLQGLSDLDLLHRLLSELAPQVSAVEQIAGVTTALGRLAPQRALLDLVQDIAAMPQSRIKSEREVQHAMAHLVALRGAGHDRASDQRLTEYERLSGLVYGLPVLGAEDLQDYQGNLRQSLAQLDQADADIEEFRAVTRLAAVVSDEFAEAYMAFGVGVEAAAVPEVGVDAAAVLEAGVDAAVPEAAPPERADGPAVPALAETAVAD